MPAPNYIDTVMEEEEFITAEEYMERRQRGEINPSEIRYASGNPETGYVGGFWVKLKKPRYKVMSKGVDEVFSYGY